MIKSLGKGKDGKLGIIHIATFWVCALLKTFQNRRVSSPAPVTIDSPSGDIDWKMNGVIKTWNQPQIIMQIQKSGYAYEGAVYSVIKDCK